MAKNIEFSAEEMSELHAFYTMEMEKAELRLKAIKSIIAKIGSAPLKRGPKPSVKKQQNNEVASELVELNKTKVAGRKPGRPAKAKSINAEPKITKRPGRPAKVKSDIVTLDLVAKSEVISVPKKRGPKPGTKYKKSAVKKTRVSKTPKLKLAKTENSKSVSVESSSANSSVQGSTKKRGPKPGAKYSKRSVEANPIIESKTTSSEVKTKQSVSKKSKPSKTPKVAKKVTAVKSSETVSAVVVSKPTEINKEIESLKNSVAKLNKTIEVKVAKSPKSPKAVVVKPTKTTAVKVNNSAKKSPVVKVKAPAKVVAKVESKEPKA